MSRKNFDEQGFVEQIMEDMKVTPEDIDSAVVSQAGLYAFYAHQAYLAQRRADRLDMALDAQIAIADREIRKANAGVKITEKAIEQEIGRSAQIIKAKREYLDAKAFSQMLRDTLEALKHRRDCIVQTSVSNREEAKGTLRIMERMNREEEMRRRREEMAEALKK